MSRSAMPNRLAGDLCEATNVEFVDRIQLILHVGLWSKNREWNNVAI